MVIVQITPRANDDLDDIVLYSKETWGLNQARAYYSKLLATIQRLGTFPEIGRPTSHHQLRRLVHERHVIIYRFDGELVVVLRVTSVRSALPLDLSDEA